MLARGLWVGKPELPGAVAGTPFPGSVEGAVVLNKNFGKVCPTPRYKHTDATAFPRGFPNQAASSSQRSCCRKNSGEVRGPENEARIALFLECTSGRLVRRLTAPCRNITWLSSVPWPPPACPGQALGGLLRQSGRFSAH